MLAPEAHAAVIGSEPVNSRIITAKFTTKKKDIRLNIIQCYAPTNDTEEEKKDDFFQQLQAVLDRRGTKDITILMGDFNAKIGMDNTGYEDIMGTYGLGQMNDNGERFADLYALNQLVIGGSIFPHKRIHKATWISSKHVKENQINHICISRKFRRSWQDVRVMRGVDVSSDHHLLITVRPRLKRFTTANSTRTKYNVGLLRDKDIQAAFQISLSSRLQPLQELIEDNETDIETQWEHCKKLWQDTCEEVLGKKKTQHTRELLNRPTPDSPPDIPPTLTELPISCDKPSKAEIKKAIMTLRSGKAAGPDEIPAEAIKEDIETAVKMLYSLFGKIWEKEEVPAQWKEGIIIKLPEKETFGTAATIEGSCSCQRQARFSTGFYWRG